MVSSWVPTGSDQQRLQGQLRNAISQLTSATSSLLALKNIMAQMLGGGSDYTTIETYFSVSSGNGQPLHDVLGTASDDLQGASVQALLQRFG